MKNREAIVFAIGLCEPGLCEFAASALAGVHEHLTKVGNGAIPVHLRMGLDSISWGRRGNTGIRLESVGKKTKQSS